MESLVKKLPEIVDLNSYSSSLGYAGYFGCKGKHSLSKVDEAINSFHRFWQVTNNEKLILASTLFIDGSVDVLVKDYLYKTSDVDNYITPLIEKGIVKAGIYESDVKVNFFEKNIDGNNFEDLNRVLHVIMALGGVFGHVFIIFREAGLVVYPHDDIGFGVISVNKNNEWAKKFFYNVNDSFETHMVESNEMDSSS